MWRGSKFLWVDEITPLKIIRRYHSQCFLASGLLCYDMSFWFFVLTDNRFVDIKNTFNLIESRDYFVRFKLTCIFLKSLFCYYWKCHFIYSKWKRDKNRIQNQTNVNEKTCPVWVIKRNLKQKRVHKYTLANINNSKCKDEILSDFKDEAVHVFPI